MTFTRWASKLFVEPTVSAEPQRVVSWLFNLDPEEAQSWEFITLEMFFLKVNNHLGVSITCAYIFQFTGDQDFLSRNANLRRKNWKTETHNTKKKKSASYAKQNIFLRG